MAPIRRCSDTFCPSRTCTRATPVGRSPRGDRVGVRPLSCQRFGRPSVGLHLEDPDLSDLPLLFQDVARWYAASTIALGIRSGLVDALLAGGGTAAELAGTAGVDGDNAGRWAEESKVAGRPGLGATWPGRGLGAMLERHRCAEVGHIESRAGYVVIRAVPGVGEG